MPDPGGDKNKRRTERDPRKKARPGGIHPTLKRESVKMVLRRLAPQPEQPESDCV